MVELRCLRVTKHFSDLDCASFKRGSFINSREIDIRKGMMGAGSVPKRRNHFPVRPLFEGYNKYSNYSILSSLWGVS